MVVFFLCLVCGGCTNGPKNDGPSLVGTWAYTPSSVIVHPLSRFSVSVGSSLAQDILIHVEFKDGDGFPCRAVGELVLTLSGQDIGDVSESIDLKNAATNRNRFEGLTRTYLVRFNKIPADLNEVGVSATFIPESGKVLRAKGRVMK